MNNTYVKPEEFISPEGHLCRSRSHFSSLGVIGDEKKKGFINSETCGGKSGGAIYYIAHQGRKFRSVFGRNSGKQNLLRGLLYALILALKYGHESQWLVTSSLPLYNIVIGKHNVDENNDLLIKIKQLLKNKKVTLEYVNCNGYATKNEIAGFNIVSRFSNQSPWINKVSFQKPLLV
jgi:hypothetical protein